MYIYAVEDYLRIEGHRVGACQKLNLLGSYYFSAPRFLRRNLKKKIKSLV